MTEKKVEDHVIMLANVRLAFPSIFQMSSVKPGDKPAFSASFLMPPDHPAILIVQQAITMVANTKWGDQAAEILRALIAGDRVCLHNGDSKSQFDGYAGNMFVSARSPSRHLVIAQDRSLLAETDGKPYSGCYVNAQIAVWAMQNSYGKRVNAQLRGVQFLRDGDAFGGGAVAQAEEFEVIESGDADAPVPTAANWDTPPAAPAVPAVAPVAPPAAAPAAAVAPANWADLV